MVSSRFVKSNVFQSIQSSQQGYKVMFLPLICSCFYTLFSYMKNPFTLKTFAFPAGIHKKCLLDVYAAFSSNLG